MKFSKLLVVFLNSYMIQFCVCKFYTSSYQLSKLLETEKKILSSLNGYFERQEKRGVKFDPEVKEFVEYAEKQNNYTTETMRAIENPLSVFYLLYRAVNKWSELAKNLSCNEEQEDECPILTGADVIDVVKRRSASDWPTETEIKHAATAVVNVWIVYDLDLDHVITGRIGGVSERPLSADEIFFIANAARDAGMTYEAITWFEYLLDRLENFDSRTFKISSLYRRLALTYKENGMQSRAVELLQKYLNIDADDSGVARDLNYLKTSVTDDSVKELKRFASNDKSKQTRSRRQFEMLCRISVTGNNNTNKLQCSLVRLYNCYGVVKVETLSKRPRIEIYYDVMTENETEEIISYGEKSFIQFREMFPVMTKPSAPDLKLQGGPLCEWNKDYPLITNVTRRLERMTKYHMYPINGVTSSECYKITNEGPGLIHAPTVDSWPSGIQPFPFAGNRLATVMLQLSDVKYGGSLVFPKLNLTVPVNRGSAVIWANLKRDGRPSTRSIHTSCPVVVGSNWALYKNILYSNQIFRRPCES